MPPSVAIMVVMIVLIVTLGKVMSRRYQSLGHQRTGTVRSADQMRADQELQQLRERVQVLERVITDNHGSADLDRQIERLRDR